MWREKSNYTIDLMARCLEVTRQGYYYWVSNKVKRDRKDIALKSFCKKVYDIWANSNRRFGLRRIYHKLEGKYSMYMVQKAMVVSNICSIQHNPHKITTIQSGKKDNRKDLIKRNFLSAVPFTKLCGDITYLKVNDKFLYLGTVIDLCTHLVVGWAISSTMKTDLVIEALSNAKRNYNIAIGAIFHSDKGSQYTSKKFANWARKNDIVLSCGKTGICWDNAVAESFFSMLKTEMYQNEHFEDEKELIGAVFEYIEIFYNRQRPHSTIGNITPYEKLEQRYESYKSDSQRG
jgi:transposase InsO family protein